MHSSLKSLGADLNTLLAADAPASAKDAAAKMLSQIDQILKVPYEKVHFLSISLIKSSPFADIN
jgi:hypothetical protein